MHSLTSVGYWWPHLLRCMEFANSPLRGLQFKSDLHNLHLSSAGSVWLIAYQICRPRPSRSAQSYSYHSSHSVSPDRSPAHDRTPEHCILHSSSCQRCSVSQKRSVSTRLVSGSLQGFCLWSSGLRLHHTVQERTLESIIWLQFYPPVHLKHLGNGSQAENLLRS